MTEFIQHCMEPFINRPLQPKVIFLNVVLYKIQIIYMISLFQVYYNEHWTVDIFTLAMPSNPSSTNGWANVSYSYHNQPTMQPTVCQRCQPFPNLGPTMCATREASLSKLVQNKHMGECVQK